MAVAGPAIAAGYGMTRVQRLLLPLVAGILILTPLQWWLAAAIVAGRRESADTRSPWFFGGIRFEPTPRWFGDYGMHLWFIAFLLAYSLLCLPLLAALRRPSGVAAAARGWHRVPTPVLLLALFMPILASQWLLRIPAPTYRDWADFALWLGFFAVGVILIAEQSLLDTVVRNGPRLVSHWRSRAPAGRGRCRGRAGDRPCPGRPGARRCRGSSSRQCWMRPASATSRLRTAAAGALVAAAPVAGGALVRSQPAWLPRANRAVLPFYVLHHPVSVAVAAVVVQWRLGLWPKLGVILVVSLAGSLALTEVVMRSRLGRALFGIPNGHRAS